MLSEKDIADAVEVSPTVLLSARLFARYHSVPGASEKSFGFGLAEMPDFAATLRRIADRIERGEIAPQAVRISTSTSVEEFCMTHIEIDCAERI